MTEDNHGKSKDISVSRDLQVNKTGSLRYGSIRRYAVVIYPLTSLLLYIVPGQQADGLCDKK